MLYTGGIIWNLTLMFKLSFMSEKEGINFWLYMDYMYYIFENPRVFSFVLC
jgi:hypothetical protein